MLMVVSISCSEMFEPNPMDRQNLDFVIDDASRAEGILLDAYFGLPGALEFNNTEAATDNAVTNDVTSNYIKMARGEWSSVLNPVSKWDLYSRIASANLFLSIADQVVWSWTSKEASKMFASRFKGEAYGLRAWLFFEILRNHGGIATNDQLLGVPLLTKELLSVKDNWALPRESYAACLEQIYSDIDKALENLPYTWKDDPDADKKRVYGPLNKNRMDGRAVQALRSRVALFAASPAFNGGVYNESACIKAAEFTAPILIEAGGVAAVKTGGLLFYDKDDDVNNPEIIWRCDYKDDNALEKNNFPPSMFGKGRINPTQNLVDAFPMINGYPIEHPSSGYNSATPYTGRDPRLANFIVFNGGKISTTTISTTVESQMDGINRIQESTRTGYYLKKLMREDTKLTPGAETKRRHFYSHFRYTEICLNYAEAANEAWGPDGDPKGYGFTARSLISAIRKRAGITGSDPYLSSITTKEAMRSLIQNERRLELCFEGFRFWDLRRLNKPLNETAKGMKIEGGVYSIVDVETRLFQDYMNFGPIPRSEVIKYNTLLQNKGW